ncbi:MAG TPA: ABC-type transport auxiliary lipoprotein family protein [Nevskiaceae bacterium]
MIRSGRLALTFAALALAACAGGPPPQIYRLAPSVPQAAAIPAAGTVQVTAVHIPDTLDRRALVRELSSTRLQFDAAARWSAPLGEMIQNVLTTDLQARLGSAEVLPPSATPPPGATRVTLQVLEFAPDAAGTVRFNGSWSRFDANGAVHNFPLRFEAASQAGDADSQAAAMSHIVGRIADAIASELRTSSVR